MKSGRPTDTAKHLNRWGEPRNSNGSSKLDQAQQQWWLNQTGARVLYVPSTPAEFTTNSNGDPVVVTRRMRRTLMRRIARAHQ